LTSRGTPIFTTWRLPSRSACGLVAAPPDGPGVPKPTKV
jgi:hypothetical protein